MGMGVSCTRMCNVQGLFVGVGLGARVWPAKKGGLRGQEVVGGCARGRRAVEQRQCCVR